MVINSHLTLVYLLHKGLDNEDVAWRNREDLAGPIQE